MLANHTVIVVAPHPLSPYILVTLDPPALTPQRRHHHRTIAPFSRFKAIQLSGTHHLQITPTRTPLLQMVFIAPELDPRSLFHSEETVSVQQRLLLYPC